MVAMLGMATLVAFLAAVRRFSVRRPIEPPFDYLIATPADHGLSHGDVSLPVTHHASGPPQGS